MHPKLLLDDDDDYDYDNVDKDNDNDNDKLIADTIWAKLVTFSIFIFSHCHFRHHPASHKKGAMTYIPLPRLQHENKSFFFLDKGWNRVHLALRRKQNPFWILALRWPFRICLNPIHPCAPKILHTAGPLSTDYTHFPQTLQQWQLQLKTHTQRQTHIQRQTHTQRQ